MESEGCAAKKLDGQHARRPHVDNCNVAVTNAGPTTAAIAVLMFIVVQPTPKLQRFCFVFCLSSFSNPVCDEETVVRRRDRGEFGSLACL